MQPLHVLLVEDREEEAELVLLELRRRGYAPIHRRVDTPEAMNEALDQGGWSLVLSDYSMPRFDAIQALALLKRRDLDLPFIIVSGTIGEETAVRAMRSGAHDYLIKGNLTRLAAAIERELREAEERRERRKAEEALQRSEEQLRQSQKMEAVGQLAGGVAHDFNNLLNVIMGYSELAARGMEPSDPRRGHLEQVQYAAERAASLTRQLLAFSRKQVVAPKVFDLNKLIGDLRKMLRRLIGEDVELVTKCGENLDWIKADPGQIEQVIMNLVVNARDAMPDGGTIVVETANVEIEPARSRQHGVPPGPYVLLVVRDTGMGIRAEIRAHIFEPFFTTKKEGKGTGLGLATVYGIVQQAQGLIELESEPGHGAAFAIYLPRADGAVAQAPLAPAASTRGTETVLVVEDERTVQNVVYEILTSCGYTVLMADSAEAALATCELHGGPIHLLMSDVVLPRMNGRELARRLGAERPDLKVLFMSGYSSDTFVLKALLDEGAAFLQKPFALTTLASKVREILDGKLVGRS